MSFYWKVRLYHRNGDYYTCQLQTNPDLREIQLIQEFYTRLTGCLMILEAMSGDSNPKMESLGVAFSKLWEVRK